MGFYIETDANLNKAEYLVKKENAVIVNKPKLFSDISSDKALICVVNNSFFEAAAYCYSERELDAFSGSNDYRPKTWLTMDKERAEKLSGYKC